MLSIDCARDLQRGRLLMNPTLKPLGQVPGWSSVRRKQITKTGDQMIAWAGRQAIATRHDVEVVEHVRVAPRAPAFFKYNELSIVGVSRPIPATWPSAVLKG